MIAAAVTRQEEQSVSALVDLILESLDANLLTAEVNAVFVERMELWAGEIFDDLGVAVSFNIQDPRVVQFLEAFGGQRIRGMTVTTRNQLQRTLSEGVLAGEGQDAIARRITGTFGRISTGRARTIARTEVSRAANFTTWQAQEQSGVVEQRQWITTLDSDARETHLDANAQVVAIDKPFMVAGLPTMYPGNTGDPAEDINERCTTVAVILEPPREPLTDEEREDLPERTVRPWSKAQLDAIWRQFDRRTMPWERAALAGFRRGFANQSREVVAAARRLI